MVLVRRDVRLKTEASQDDPAIKELQKKKKILSIGTKREFVPEIQTATKGKTTETTEKDKEGETERIENAKSLESSERFFSFFFM